MSFMSFDYAIKASEATLQFHQQQGQNIKDTSARSREVGTGNAKRKDDLVRQKIEAEYAARSADIKKDKAMAMMKLAEERKKTAQLAAGIVGIGAFAGGMIDGIKDMMSKKDGTVPESAQMAAGAESARQGMAASFRINQGPGNGNSEQGAIVSYDQTNRNFNLVSINTSNGNPNGFVQVSQTDMARNILGIAGAQGGAQGSATGNLRAMVKEGPPPQFDPAHLNPQTGEMSQELKNALFGDNGFFKQGSTGGGNDVAETMVAGMLRNPAAISTGYQQTADNVMSLLGNDKIRAGLGIDQSTVDKTEKAFENAGLTIGTGDKLLGGASSGFQKAIFKPLGTALPQFLELAKVAKQYAEEYEAKLQEYEQAKKQAALARQKLQKIESLLAAGSDAS